jgi:hypothetical protein
MREQEQQCGMRRGHDHTGHATAKLSGDLPSVVVVYFKSKQELDHLIHLLEDLRDNPRLQMHHVHLQDYSMCGPPWQLKRVRMKPEDAEVVFHSPRYRRNDIDHQLVAEAARFMRSARERRRRTRKAGSCG